MVVYQENCRRGLLHDFSRMAIFELSERSDTCASSERADRANRVSFGLTAPILRLGFRAKARAPQIASTVR